MLLLYNFNKSELQDNHLERKYDQNNTFKFQLP